MRNINSKIIALFIIASLPGLAYANAGVPMLMLAMPVYAISLLPIIGIESLYLSKKLSLELHQALKAVSISNLASTLVGIPITWVLLVFIQMVTGGGSSYEVSTTFGKIIAVTWQAPWLIPHEKELGWMIPVAGTFLLVPFYFASWWSEYFVSIKMLKNQSPIELKKYTRNANLITYLLLALWPLGMYIKGSV